jgi:hypothetical protein
VSEEFRPVAEVLPGVEIVGLGDGAIPLEAVVLVKALDAEGEMGWYTRYTKGLHSIEALGAIRAAELLEQERVIALYEPDA